MVLRDSIKSQKTHRLTTDAFLYDIWGRGRCGSGLIPRVIHSLFHALNLLTHRFQHRVSQ